MKEFIPLSVPNLKGNELTYISKAITTEWVSTEGTYVAEFERGIADYVGVERAVACQSGTAGLHLSLLVCGINQGDEVIVPSLTFIAAVNPIQYVGASPIFMDCDDTLTIDPIKLRNFCEQQCDMLEGVLINKKTKKPVTAIIVVHVFGNIADMEQIVQIGKEYNLKIIEDATEALGSYVTEGLYQGRHAGTIGDIGVYSFNGNKIITTGGGGMIVSHNNFYLDKCKYLSTQAKNDTLYFIHDEVGYNYRMTNLQAAIGLAQLERLEEFIWIKKSNYEEYNKYGVTLLPYRDDIRPNYWFYSYMCDTRDELLYYLNEHKIQTRPIWKLIHTLKPYRDKQSYQIKKASYYYDKVLNIPCSSNLTKEEVHRVIDAIKEYTKE